MITVRFISFFWLKALRGGLGRGLGEGRRVGVLGDIRNRYFGLVGVVL